MLQLGGNDPIFTGHCAQERLFKSVANSGTNSPDFLGSLRELLQMFAAYLSQDLLGLFGSDSSQIVTLPVITVHYLYLPITSIHIHIVIHGHVWDMLGYIRHVQGTIWRATRLPDSSDIRLNGRAV